MPSTRSTKLCSNNIIKAVKKRQPSDDKITKTKEKRKKFKNENAEPLISDDSVVDDISREFNLCHKNNENQFVTDYCGEFTDNSHTNEFSLNAEKSGPPNQTESKIEIFVLTKNHDDKSQDWPSTRWGHSMTTCSTTKFLIGGQTGGSKFCKDPLWSYDLNSEKWSSKSNLEGIPSARLGHAVVYDPSTKCIYVIGGSKQNKWYSDVHVLDTTTLTWRKINYSGVAPEISYHSATLFKYEIWIFGGIIPKPGEEPDECISKVHAFNTLEELWYQPVIIGQPPSSRSGHSANLIDQDRLVIFGGWDAPNCFDDTHVLDLCIGDWKSLNMDLKPEKRTWHSSCSFANKILIHGGYNGEIALNDTFILDTNLKNNWQWTQLNMSSLLKRTGHSCSIVENDDGTVRIFIFGGGDNEGEFYNDFFEMRLKN